MKCPHCDYAVPEASKRPKQALGMHIVDAHLEEMAAPKHDPAYMAKVNSFVSSIKREGVQQPQEPSVPVPACSKCSRPVNMTVSFGNGTYSRVPTFFHPGQSAHYADYECMTDDQLANLARTRTPVRSA